MSCHVSDVSQLSWLSCLQLFWLFKQTTHAVFWASILKKSIEGNSGKMTCLLTTVYSVCRTDELIVHKFTSLLNDNDFLNPHIEQMR